MKAVQLMGFGDAHVMRLVDLPQPQPAVGQVLIRVAASSVNRPDIVQRLGRYPPPAGESEVLGLEVAGRIEDLGPGVTEFQVGDRVFALVGGGAYAEFALAHAGLVLPMPAAMTFEAAACIAETYITAFQNLYLGARLIDGESVLLHGGGGGVNTAAVQIVSALSPTSRIFVTASTRKLDRVRALGADHVIDYSMQDFAELVLDQTKGGVDVILDHIGAAYLERNLSCLAINGRLAIIAVMGGATAELNLARLMVRRHSILGSVLRPRPVSDKADIIARFRDTVLPFFVRGEIVPVIDSVYPLADVVAAHQRMEASEHFGKIVLTMNANEM